jgi:hypothetical protein
MTVENLTIGIQGLLKLRGQAMPLLFFGIAEQILNQRLNGRHVVVAGTPPGDIVQQAMNLFGDPAASGRRKPSLANDIVDKMDTFRDRALAYRHA